jgi:predicted nucleotidyltransferase
MSPLDNKIKDKIKGTVMSLDSNAEVYIYGSRARGDASVESDWDVMVITSRPVTPQLKRSMRHALYEIEWDNECVISSIIHSRAEWDNHLMRTTPFYRNVTREAVRI